eukprot:3083020-Pyramimonas_sp.AAC.1
MSISLHCPQSHSMENQVTDIPVKCGGCDADIPPPKLFMICNGDLCGYTLCMDCAGNQAGKHVQKKRQTGEGVAVTHSPPKAQGSTGTAHTVAISTPVKTMDRRAQAQAASPLNTMDDGTSLDRDAVAARQATFEENLNEADGPLTTKSLTAILQIHLKPIRDDIEAIKKH